MRFRLLDRILSWEAHTRIRGVKSVSFEEYNLKAPFGDPPCLPETLLMESLFQLGNWLIVLSSDFTQRGLLVRFDETRFEDRLRPGETLHMEVEVRSYRRDGVRFDGRGYAGDRLIGAGRGCLATLVPLAEFEDPADLRVLYSEIHRPATEPS